MKYHDFRMWNIFLKDRKLALTLDTQRQRLAGAFTAAIDGRASVESGTSVGNGPEDQANVA